MQFVSRIGLHLKLIICVIKSLKKNKGNEN